MNKKQPLILGVIVEFNPFHNGHNYFINTIRERLNPDVLIAITTTSFSMRGEIAIIDKFCKTDIMLEKGIDLVVELPHPLGVQSADYFAYHSIKILSDLGITDLAFGIEADNLNQLLILDQLINHPDFQKVLKKELQNPTSYKVSYSEALKKFKVDPELIELFNQPNATLGFQYLQAIKKLGNKIIIHGIERRESSYHDTHIHSNFASAKAIRYALQKGKEITSQLPFPVNAYRFINQETSEKRLFELLQYQLLVCLPDFQEIFGFSEGIENYLIHNMEQCKNLNDYLEKLKNKRYSTSRINRLFTYLLLHIPKNIDLNHPYLRILGFTEKGESYLHSLDSEIKKRIITTLKNNNHPYALIEERATKLYGLLTGQPDLYLQEYQIPLKRKENI